MQGFLLIDKPPDITSFFCVKILRKLSQEKRIGFVGTLDPLATGLMLFALGEMRKLLSYLEGLDKVYEVVIRLGAISDTYDAKGNIEYVPDPSFPSLQAIKTILQEHFSDERQQQPPAFSAIQIEGKRAYDLARKGQTVHLKKRPVTFYEITVLDYKPPFLSLRVHCSSGTYIRSLAHDLGQSIGCGGYVEKLRRRAIGTFHIEKAVPLSALTAENIHSHLLRPLDIFPDVHPIILSPVEYEKLSHGGFVPFKLETLPNKKNIPLLAYFQNDCVGVVEPVKDKPGLIKFSRTFHLD